ncbi:MAG: glycosyltransferase family 39 protein, partial [Chloroflexota bacterium]|nr:glycosyltransferase family 39 protein [Chloroflexota bacterium]
MTRRKQLILLLLMVVALGLRIWYLRINPLWPQFSNADDGDYYRRALRLAVTGQYLDDAWLIRPPFHVWVFAALIRLAIEAGGSPTAGVRLIQALQAAMGAGMVPLCYALGRRLFDWRAGLIFAGFWAVWFPFVELPATLFSEPIYLFLWTLHLWLLLRFDAHDRLRDIAAAGLVLGMAALTRSPALYALVFAVPWLVWRDLRCKRAEAATTERRAFMGQLLRSVRSAIRPFAVLAATTLIVVLPWTARNWVVYHKVILIDTLGPINLWLDLGEAHERDAKIQALEAVPQGERQALAMREARAILAADPLRPVRPMWGTFRHIWKAQYVEDYFVKRSFFARPLREAAPLGLLSDALWLVFTLAGVAGVLHPATDRPFKIVTALWLVYSIVTVLVFHVEPRYLLSIWLLLGLYGAAVLAAPIDRGRMLWQRPRRGALVAGSLLILVWLFVGYRDYPAIISRGLRRETYMWRGETAYRRGDYTAAEQAFRNALAADPGFVDAEVSLALALAAQGRPEEGIGVINRGGSRRSALVEGALRRVTGDLETARELLRPSEHRSGEDAQQWSLAMLRPDPRASLVLGDDALDLGY